MPDQGPQIPGFPHDGAPDDLSDMKPADRAYHVIREAILSGELAPGSHLAESQLAAMCNSSRTPVREALQRLTAEGLALSEGRSRFVANFTYHEVSIVFDLRARIEAYVAQIAARLITPRELDMMEQLVEEMDRLDRGEFEAFHNLNGEFHDAILRAARSEQLRSVTRQVFALPLTVIKQSFCNQPIDIVHSNAQHKDILGALRARDEGWASSAMLVHLLSTKPAPPDEAGAPGLGTLLPPGLSTSVPPRTS